MPGLSARSSMQEGGTRRQSSCTHYPIKHRVSRNRFWDGRAGAGVRAASGAVGGDPQSAYAPARLLTVLSMPQDPSCRVFPFAGVGSFPVLSPHFPVDFRLTIHHGIGVTESANPFAAGSCPTPMMPLFLHYPGVYRTSTSVGRSTIEPSSGISTHAACGSCLNSRRWPSMHTLDGRRAEYTLALAAL